MSARTGDPERLVADQPEQNTNEVMTEDVETPHHEVTDEPVVPDSEAEDDLVTEQETEQNHCHPMRARRPPNVMISWEILAITLAVPQVFKYQQPILFLVK